MRDNQKRKVYNWEDSLIPTTNDLSKQECIHIINELNKIYLDDNYRKKLIKTRKVFFKKKNKLLKLIENEI